MCPGADRGQNNWPHIVKIMVYSHNVWPFFFDNSIKMVSWLLDHNLRKLEKIKVASYLQSGQFFLYLPATVWTLAAKYERIPLKIIYPTVTQR